MRLLILDVLQKQSSAVSINDIESNFEACDRITLFRTLKTFERKGLIHKIEDGKVIRYALCSDNCSEGLHLDAHLHFFCKSCKKTICLQEIKIPEISLPHDFQLEEFNLVARGICQTCR